MSSRPDSFLRRPAVLGPRGQVFRYLLLTDVKYAVRTRFKVLPSRLRRSLISRRWGNIRKNIVHMQSHDNVRLG